MNVEKKRLLPVTIRVLTFILIVDFVIVWMNKTDNASTNAIVKLSLLAMCCFCSRLLFSVSDKKTTRFLVILLCFWVCYESVLGILQNYGFIKSNHTYYQITGSFINPNPYAGFLAVCFGILLSYLISYKGESKYVRLIIIVSLGLVALVLPSTKCRSAFCAVLAVIVIMVMETDRYRRFLLSKAFMVVPSVALLFLLLYLWKKPSADWRLFQNKISILTIQKAPLLGYGLGHYNGAASSTQLKYFHDSLSLDNGKVIIPEAYSKECRTAGRTEYAFCDPLQIGVEAGIITMMTYLILVVLSLIQLYKFRSPLFYGAVALQTISLFSYPLLVWQTESLFAVMVGASGRYISANKYRILPDLLGILLIAFILLLCYPRYVSVRNGLESWQSDRLFYNLGEYELYSIYCEDKVSSQDCNGDFLLEYGIALSETGKYGLSDSILSVGFSICGNPAFQIALGDNSVQRGDYQSAEQYYWNSFCCIPDRLYPLSKLAKMYKLADKADCLYNLQLFVDGFNPRIESEITDMLRNEIRMLSENEKQ